MYNKRYNPYKRDGSSRPPNPYSKERSIYPSRKYYSEEYSQQQRKEFLKQRAAHRRTKNQEPSRVLFARNISYLTKEEVIQKLFEQQGDVRKFFALIRKRGMCFVTYYDIRSAIKAKQNLQDKDLDGRLIDIHYSLPRNNEEEASSNDDRIRVTISGTDAVSNEEVENFFSKWGEIETVSNGAVANQKVIRYYDVRSASNACKEANGKQFTLPNTKLEIVMIPGEVSREPPTPHPTGPIRNRRDHSRRDYDRHSHERSSRYRSDSDYYRSRRSRERDRHRSDYSPSRSHSNNVPAISQNLLGKNLPLQNSSQNQLNPLLLSLLNNPALVNSLLPQQTPGLQQPNLPQQNLQQPPNAALQPQNLLSQQNLLSLLANNSQPNQPPQQSFPPNLANIAETLLQQNQQNQQAPYQPPNPLDSLDHHQHHHQHHHH